jgi:hypothetical protein
MIAISLCEPTLIFERETIKPIKLEPSQRSGIVVIQASEGGIGALIQVSADCKEWSDLMPEYVGTRTVTIDYQVPPTIAYANAPVFLRLQLTPLLDAKVYVSACVIPT